jgi:hypothetical protein
MSDKIGESIMESVGDGIVRMLDESMTEMEAMKTDSGLQVESYGTPKVKNETILIPVVVAVVVDGTDRPTSGDLQKIDQAFIDKNMNLILQKLVLTLNPGDDYGMGRRRGGMIFFDPDNFKMEYIEGGVVKLTTTLVCDLRPVISEMRGLRWKLENCLYGIAEKVKK